MAATLAEIREALATNLRAIKGCQVNAYELGNPTPPTLEVAPGDPLIEYDLAFNRGGDRYMLLVRGVVALGSDIGAQKKLDQYLAPDGPLSVKAAVEAELATTGANTLGGLVASCRVISCGNYRPYASEGKGVMLGAEWTVEVLT